MSQPPYGPPPTPGWTPPPPPPRRQRPRVLWFFVAGAMILAAPLIFAGALFTVLRPLTQEDAVFAVAESPVQVDLPAGEERALFSTEGLSADCAVTDGSGRPVDLRPVTGEFNYNEWTAVWRFDTGDGDLTFDCTGVTGHEEIRIAQLPSTGGFVIGILVGVIGPLLVGGSGLIMLVIVTILWATGAPRQKR